MSCDAIVCGNGSHCASEVVSDRVEIGVSFPECEIIEPEGTTAGGCREIRLRVALVASAVVSAGVVLDAMFADLMLEQQGLGTALSALAASAGSFADAPSALEPDSFATDPGNAKSRSRTHRTHSITWDVRMHAKREEMMIK